MYNPIHRVRREIEREKGRGREREREKRKKGKRELLSDRAFNTTARIS
jgi:hypothetical protein